MTILSMCASVVNAEKVSDESQAILITLVAIKDYVLGQNLNAGKDETLYICNYCKSFIKKDVTFEVCPQWT